MSAPKPYRSKLIPFEAEIVALRRRRPPTPYSEIVRLLKDSHGVTVQVSTLFNFVKVRRKWDRLYPTAAEPLPSSTGKSQRVTAPIKAETVVQPPGKTLPLRSVEPSSGRASVPPPKPSGKALKSFTSSSEYNLERLTPEQMAEWLDELKREQEGG
jgi:hypothetical protein